MNFFAEHDLFPSPIWPSAVVALVVSLFRGGLAAPGVFTGSLLTDHLSIGARLHLLLQRLGPLVQSGHDRSTPGWTGAL